MDDEAVELASGTALLVPRGTVRSITAGEGGLRYLTVHARRGPLTIGVPGEHDRAQPGDPGEAVVVREQGVEADGEQEHLQRQEHDDEDAEGGRDLALGPGPARAGAVCRETVTRSVAASRAGFR